jgi:hypothetical protein
VSTIKMRNATGQPLTVPGELLDASSYPEPEPGKRLAKPRHVTLRPGQVVSVAVGYALPRRSDKGAAMPSLASEWSDGRLVPHGPEAEAWARVCVDDHPEVQLRQIEDEDRSYKYHSDIMGARSGPSAGVLGLTDEERRMLELGRRQAAAMGKASEPAVSQPLADFDDDERTAETPLPDLSH